MNLLLNLVALYGFWLMASLALQVIPNELLLVAAGLIAFVLLWNRVTGPDPGLELRHDGSRSVWDEGDWLNALREASRDGFKHPAIVAYARMPLRFVTPRVRWSGVEWVCATWWSGDKPQGLALVGDTPAEAVDHWIRARVYHHFADTRHAQRHEWPGMKLARKGFGPRIKIDLRCTLDHGHAHGLPQTP